MPCIFCIAVFAMLAGAITTTVLDQLEARLSAAADSPVRRTIDTGSATKFEFTVPGPSARAALHLPAAVPVAVTVYKQHRRARIQILTHALDKATCEAVEDHVAAVAGLQIISRADAHADLHSPQADRTTAQPPKQRTRRLRPPKLTD